MMGGSGASCGAVVSVDMKWLCCCSVCFLRDVMEGCYYLLCAPDYVVADSLDVAQTV